MRCKLLVRGTRAQPWPTALAGDADAMQHRNQVAAALATRWSTPMSTLCSRSYDPVHEASEP